MPEIFNTIPWPPDISRPQGTKMSASCPPLQRVPSEGSKAERLRCLVETFTSEFSAKPQFCARAPGRVNLIGEHVDYCGYAVFPMAIDLDILIAVGSNATGKLNLINVEDSYPKFSCEINNFEIDKSHPTWYNYILCGVQGIQEEGGRNEPFTGLDMAVSGNIPPSSGLSSSSALVCASALAVAHSHKLSISKEDFAEICARCERHVGTQGGGMDQAISFLATEGTARVIEFNPLRSTPVNLPSGVSFVVANSLAPMNKAANSYYNCRVMECRLACQIMAKQAGLAWKEYQRLGQLQKVLGKSLPEMMTLVSRTFESRPYSKKEICKLLGTSEEDLDKTTLSENTRSIEEFLLHDRAQHVFSEAHRVWEFKRICDEKSDKSVEELGKLMKESHLSTKLLYECSHPKLDKLVDLSEGVTFGARLTGAGWGGCMVAMVKEEEAEEYKELLVKEYYSQEANTKDKDINSVLFSSQPSPGACIYEF
ncbi:N-acetylgalactosamine kinase isoform X1 [Macrobrachium rosenbergii]|uniref:N-acetylgalactosamine kinase isoform X1 n=2 Tax=Macrobrachium rosenbergii TaxID=79674 RepID=UPI0034D5A7BE